MNDPRLSPHAADAAAVVAVLDSDAQTGLSTAEAARRLQTVGPNQLATAAATPSWRRFAAQFASPLVLLLLGATIVSLIAWWMEGHDGVPYEALVILAIVLANAVLGAVQEARAEAAVAALRGLTASRATVLRDGVRALVAVESLVPGDILVIGEGALVPADARIVDTASLRAIEAALTGESEPVSKQTQPVAADLLAADRTNMLFAGTAVVFGHARAVVTATGMATEIGRIAGLLARTEDERTPLQAQLDKTGKVLGAVVIVIAAIVALTLVAIHRDFSAAALTTTLLYAVALAVAAVPEGLAAITTLVLSLGMQRMAERNVVVRRLSAVETLGAATIICSDKTGTLTKNEMTVRALVTASGRVDLTGAGYDTAGTLLAGGAPLAPGALRTEVDALLEAAFVSNNAELVVERGAVRVAGDPTEGALKVAALKSGLLADRMHARYPRVGELPFSSERKLMSTAHAAAGDETTLFVKGAPEVLLALCHRERVGDEERPLDDARRAALTQAIDALAGEAMRPLGLACRALAGEVMQPGVERHLVWLGVAGLVDPPRPEARVAVQAAHDAGVRVVMITGDHPRSAAAIAQELGIAAAPARVLAGRDIEAMDDPALRNAVADTDVYARVSPEHKLRIVHALRARGEVVAMTGDGVNDAPALKAADIGVAMGRDGTDVAKGAADMVLLDDNFASIVAAIEEGRAIYANIQKFLRYLLATNLGEVAVMFLGVVAAPWLGIGAEPGAAVAIVLPLTAAMILWINLVTDAGPALALGVDPAGRHLMKRPPRSPSLGIVTPAMWRGIAVVAAAMAVGTLGVLDAALPGGFIEGDGSLAHARTLAFHTLVLFSLFAVFAARSDNASAVRGLFGNRWLWGSVLLALALQAAVLYVAPLRRAFDTAPLSAQDWLVAAAVASSALWAREVQKAWWRFAARR